MMELQRLVEALRRGVEKASELGISVSIAVTDERGNVVVLYRMPGAYEFSPTVALAKARTAAQFGRSTAQLAERAAANPMLYIGLTVHAGLIFGKGGLPVVRDGKVMGAVGVSGGTGDQDEEVASRVVEALTS